MPMIDRTGAGALIPIETVNEILKGVRTSSVAMQLMRRLPNMSTNQSQMPVLSMLPVADFVNGDAGLKITTEAAWDKKMMSVGEIAAIVNNLEKRSTGHHQKSGRSAGIYANIF